MKGWRFYAEYDSPRDKRKRNGNGNVIAVNLESYERGEYEALAPIFFHENSATSYDSVSLQYLWTHCRRIPEAEARVIHPALFERLDQAIAEAMAEEKKNGQVPDANGLRGA